MVANGSDDARNSSDASTRAAYTGAFDKVGASSASPPMTWKLLGDGAGCLLVAMMLIMAAGWLVAIKSGNTGWIDVCWTFGLGLVGIGAAVLPSVLFHPDATDGPQGIAGRGVLCAVLIAAWSLRLGIHIARRSHASGDDPRYAQLRKEWGAHYPSRLFLFLQIQAIAGLPLLLGVLVAACRPGPLGDIRDVAAVVLFCIAVGGEAAADRSLRRFGKLPHRREAVCDIGLWRWSRHPNYFFEWLAWLAWPVMALGSAGYPWGGWTLLAPILMYWLLVHVSGIPPLEAHMARSRGAAWQAYVAKTSAFFPLPRKK